MEAQQQIGAQALLQLGNKHDKGKGSDEEYSGDEDEKTQLLNDAVEAAVMRYVGGTLEERKRRKSIANGNQTMENGPSGDENSSRGGPAVVDDMLSEFGPWTGFLDEGAIAADVAHEVFRQTPRKKRKKDSHNVDPELAGLDDLLEHDRLVQAAIMDAREIAKHLDQHGSLKGGDRRLQMAPMAPGMMPITPIEHQQQQGALRGRSRVTGAAGTNPAAHHVQHRQGGASTGGHQGSIQTTANGGSNPLQHSGQQVPVSLYGTSFHPATSMEALVEECTAQTCTWYNNHAQQFTGGPRAFAPEELDAVERFIDGYGLINKLTRRDVCHRIWLKERRKDNFWELLTRILPYRLRALVYKHVRRQFHVFDVRGKWTKEEDAYLKRLGETKQGNWKELGEIMGRMPEDVRDRWRNYIKCGDNRSLNKWTPEEEAKLCQVVETLLAEYDGKTTSGSNDGTRAGNSDNSSKLGGTGSQGSEIDSGYKPINWTIVSERMNGVRLRIQCRYKWNKMVKKKQEVVVPDNHLKLWLVRKIQLLGFLTRDAVDWAYLGHLLSEEKKKKQQLKSDRTPQSEDLRLLFERMETEVPNHRKKRLLEVVDELERVYGKIAPAIETAPQDNTEEYQHDDEAAQIANAAVAAVGSVDGDVQHQEYSLWR